MCFDFSLTFVRSIENMIILLLSQHAYYEICSIYIEMYGTSKKTLCSRRMDFIGNMFCEFLLLLRWGENVSLWNWASNGPFVHPPDDISVNMEQQWNDNDRGKPKNSEKNLSQCHFVHHRSYKN
jgi:hypothetical protein